MSESVEQQIINALLSYQDINFFFLLILAVEFMIKFVYSTEIHFLADILAIYFTSLEN